MRVSTAQGVLIPPNGKKDPVLTTLDPRLTKTLDQDSHIDRKPDVIPPVIGLWVTITHQSVGAASRDPSHLELAPPAHGGRTKITKVLVHFLFQQG